MKIKLMIEKTTVERAWLELEVPVSKPADVDQESWDSWNDDEKLEAVAFDRAEDRDLWTWEDEQTTMIKLEETK